MGHVALLIVIALNSITAIAVHLLVLPCALILNLTVMIVTVVLECGCAPRSREQSNANC
jgi:hypothetical protein